MSTFSTQGAIMLGIIVVSFPTVARIFLSPYVLLLLSPLILVFIAVASVGLHVCIGHWLDSWQKNGRTSLSSAARPYAFSTPAAWQAVLTRSQWSQSAPQTFPPLYPESKMISSTLNDILILIVRDFVLTWYKDISSSPSFPTAVSSVLHSSLSKLLDRAESVDLAALLVNRILPKITAHIEQFRQSEMALRGAGLERRLTQSEELDILLASRYATKGGEKLHPAIDNLSTTFTKQTEEAHLRQLIDKVLPYMLPETEAKSQALKIVAREIASCSVLYPIMDMVADPDFWNRMIDDIRQVHHSLGGCGYTPAVRNVLEAQSPQPHNRMSTPPVAATTETITIRTDVRQFESFLRSINRCSSLLDARRLKNDIMGEIRRTRMLLGNHEKEDWINGEKTEDVVAFLDRLYTAKRTVEERIVMLGGEDELRKSTALDSGIRSGLTLRNILANPSLISYFMEFMDRRNRSLLVQFWLTVESFKNPLESVDSGSSGDEEEMIQDTSNFTTMNEDISMINDLYFSSTTPHPALSSISAKYVNRIQEFARSEVSPSLSSQRKVRRSVMRAQSQVEKAMEPDFEEFQRSELWFRVAGDMEVGSKKQSAPPSLTEGPTSVSPPALVGSSLPFHFSWGNHSTQSLPPRPEAAPMLRATSSGSQVSVDLSRRIPPPDMELLMSSVPDLSGSSRAPLFDDPDAEDQKIDKSQSNRMDAIQAALTDIIATDKEESQKSSKMTAPSLSARPRPSRNVASSSEPKRTAKLVETQRPVFEDDYDDEIDEIDDDGGDSEDKIEDATDPSSSFHSAGPGDLQLSYEIGRLESKITSLQSQDAMLDKLIKKAELTGDAQELRLLKKSKTAMDREIRQFEFQKKQYEQQESANRLLSDKTRVSLVNSTVGEEDGKSVVRYLIEVQQLGPNGSFASGWIVARRYNEFLNTHIKLREKYALVKNLDFPGKRLVHALSGSFVDNRRAALEKYLQNLISIPAVCESDELRAFLSRDSPFMATEHRSSSKISPTFPGTDLVRTVYRSVAESIDDMFFGPSMLDVMIQRLTRQAAEFAGVVGAAVNDEEIVAQALDASGGKASEAALLHLSGDLKPLEGETSTSSFSSPICDLLLAVFELKKNNWLRRQAIVIILQQVLGGTIERIRKIREIFKAQLDESRLMSYLTLFRDQLWPGGQLKPPGKPRSTEEKLRTRDEANRKLSSLIPDLAANMIGRSNARRGARRIFAVLQNRRLNQHIAYTVVDEV
ncbi:PhoX domain-containing protein [Pleurotus eryngii]|uniref:PhoX domain-containing protein n=1 Tax=Pleurotus eryngii TaxID=5323 RepID=A0A9P6AAS3_PLEER|nr:PhoX domain-containing protein [Pleurotus eryngii]